MTKYFQYNLEERTLNFAKQAKAFIKSAPKSITNIEYCKQMARSSGSPGANYIEANEATSKKEFLYKIRTCLKEIKETRYWLKLIDSPSSKVRGALIQESSELIKIFGKIVSSSK